MDKDRLCSALSVIASASVSSNLFPELLHCLGDNNIDIFLKMVIKENDEVIDRVKNLPIGKDLADMIMASKSEIVEGLNLLKTGKEKALLPIFREEGTYRAKEVVVYNTRNHETIEWKSAIVLFSSERSYRIHYIGTVYKKEDWITFPSIERRSCRIMTLDELLFFKKEINNNHDFIKLWFANSSKDAQDLEQFIEMLKDPIEANYNISFKDKIIQSISSVKNNEDCETEDRNNLYEVLYQLESVLKSIG